ncbi:hypothetical protein Q7P37_007806 [Cladosporium fusiforme]
MESYKEDTQHVENLSRQASTAQGHLEKRFSKLTMTGMAFAILNTWIVLASTLAIVLPAGGPVAFFYGFFFCVLCNFCIAASLGEMASVWPTAGGQYHYAYFLSTEKWRCSMSFLVGWINLAGWLTLVTTEAMFGAQFIASAVVAGSNYTMELTPWHTYLYFLAISCFAIGLNIFGYRFLGKWNEGALFWSITAWIATSAVILATAPKTDADFVFKVFTNETGWPDGVAWILGLLQSALSLIGFDAITHLTEEMPHPTRDAPIAMIMCIAIGGTTGLAMVIVLLFCIPDPEAILTTLTGNPLIEMIIQGTNSRTAGVVMSSALSICFINGTIGSVTSGSRLLWAMGRDGGAPCSRLLSKISPHYNIPVNAIIAVMLFNVLFGLLYLGPTVAFNAYISSCTIFLNCSYAGPVIILLLRGRRVLTQEKPDFPLGRVGGYIINSVAVVFIVVTSAFFVLPNTSSVNASTMNYVSAVVAIFIVFVCVLWLFKRKSYQGPIFDHAMDQTTPTLEQSPKHSHEGAEKAG